MEAQKETVKDLKGMKVAYAVTERNGRSFWNRIGVAFTNRDGSLNVKLEAVPVSGQLQIREWEPRDEAGDTNGASKPSGESARGSRGGGNGKGGPLTELPF